MVDREGAVKNMLTIHAITTQLQSQSLAESQAHLSHSSQDENAAKIRHNSEPHPPASILSDPNKKVKIITFQDGVRKDNVALTSILLSAEPNTSASWDSANSNPPIKRQCRSMSIPNDGELHTRWLQTQARSRLHRPLAVRPNSGGSRSKSHQLSHHRNAQAGRPLPPVWPSLALSDGNTPPESPRSRPSSASSGYFDSPLASLSNLNRNRCESLQTLPSMERGARHGSGDSSASVRVISAKSMPSVADTSSPQRSPSKQLLLRCQSQPCVIHERRGGVKRRRNDEQRPSINFNKMTETAFGKLVNESSNKLTSPLKIRPTARYGQIFPDRVLQTIASSPQDMNTISTFTSNACTTPPTTSKASSPVATFPTFQNEANDSDSGCSTTDEELCDITNKMADPIGKTDSCEHKMLKNNGVSPSLDCVCLCPGDNEQDVMFAMEPNQDSELDIDMIENN